MQLTNTTAEEEGGVHQIDHEILFNFDEENVTKEEIDKNMDFLSDNLLTYLDEILHDKDSLHKALMNDALAVLSDNFDIEDSNMLGMKMEEDYDCIFDVLTSVMEKYDLSEDDVDDILDEAEYWL